MNVNIFNQIPSGLNLSNEINQIFGTGEYTSIRIIMAYVSWDGISLIHDELEKFHDNNKSIKMIIGLSGGLTDPSTLSYLLERLPKSDIFVFHTPTINYTFHPKVYIFENDNDILVYIGSNNFTLGGLFYNSECCMKMKVKKSDNPQLCIEINSIWETYRNPLSPFGQGNLKKINQAIISQYRKYNKIASKRLRKSRRTHFDEMFSIITLPAPPVTRMKKREKSIRKRSLQKGKALLLEVLKETGAEGTQVQIPRRAVEEYFELGIAGHQTIELQFKNQEVRPAVLCHFGNNTHRISTPEVAKYKRPLLMKFIKQNKEFYMVELICGAQYQQLIKNCSEQTRFGARRWTII